ncbi:MAG TPA: hypothetical protein VJG31_00130 [Candidatus Nanoarchaeia archaeon]|nr:hypothetical protein [Candidatus Nanoarchaeia archaeon]
MVQKDLTQRIENQLAEPGSLQARSGEIYILNKDYQALLVEINKPAVSASSMEISAFNQTISPAAVSSRHKLVSANSWFSALEELRRQGSGKTIAINGQTYVRPFTMKENLQARIEDYNLLTNPNGTKRTEEERKRFFNTWLDSCFGIHHLARTTRFKIIPCLNELITLAQAPTKDYLSVPYAQTSGTELDSARGKYNQNLSRAEVMKHPAWLAAVEEDQVLLGEAFDIMRTVNNAPADWNGMGFYVRPNKTQDGLRPLFVSDRGMGGSAGGRCLLVSDGRFLRSSPTS